MASETRTFSESWHRIAGGRVSLRPHVQVRRQFFRGERFYVLHDPLKNEFFRLRPAAWSFVARLRPDRTVGEVWEECVNAQPDDAPGQEHALRLLAQLHASNLLHTELSPDSVKMFERQKTRRQREAQSTLLNAMFARFPVLDPDRALKACLPAIRAVMSPAGGVVWIVALGAALKVLIDHAPALKDAGQAILSPGNLPLLYAALLGIKFLHELGHAAACRRFGGEVHTIGVMLMILVPLPYVDTTSSWSFRSRWQRAFVGAAGMIVELFVAALAAFVWAWTGPGVLHSLAYNVVLVASVSTLLFNANPLLRFDGYYILSDLLEIPNLQGRSLRQIGHLVEKHLFGAKTSRPVADSRSEGAWLAVYGVASAAYRTLLSASILLFVADRYLALGLLAFVVCMFSWVLIPLGRAIQYLATDAQLARTRSRAWAVAAGGTAAVLAALLWIPAPNHFKAPGVLEAVNHDAVSARIQGKLMEILAPTGSEVAEGQPLARLENPELELEIAEAQAELDEAQALRGVALKDATADLAPIDSRIASVEKRLARLQGQKASLVVRAAHPGVWVAPELERYRNAWIARGMELGQIVDPRAFQFSAVVSQDEASRLFAKEIRSAEVRLAGQAATALRVVSQNIIPGERERLPSAALGWHGGGDIATATGDATGTIAKERFFEVRAQIESAPGVSLRHGVSGKIRFELPSEPLLSQWLRRLRQVMQKRSAIAS